MPRRSHYTAVLVFSVKAVCRITVSERERKIGQKQNFSGIKRDSLCCRFIGQKMIVRNNCTQKQCVFLTSFIYIDQVFKISKSKLLSVTEYADFLEIRMKKSAL